eukprot:TRINITY_DN2505_c0_g1_i1.p1 TRINITY_DN2505_c0_g1~~TRINITY_DN2505_c0_g1_i1.p1  ORF type:complete len:144 (+),score=27.79 TRINITY_DN2505_c0_g1_i1:229-660(+)
MVQLSHELWARYARGDDAMSRTDLKLALIDLLGYKPSRYELGAVLRKCGADPRATSVGFDLFEMVVRDRQDSRDPDEKIRQAFRTMDTQYVGFLTYSGVKAVFEEVLPSVGAEEVRRAFNEVDEDGDGRISYREFECMMAWKP